MLVFALSSAGAAIAAQPIGTAAIVQNRVTGTPANATAPVALHLGDGLFANERVQTAADSKAQLLFQDQTALSVGPQSTIVLDKFVYDPARNVGSVVLQTVSGAFRFIGGVADSTPGSSYKVRTPVGTIGIRGTYFEWVVKGNYLWALLREGDIEVCVTNGGCETLDKPGTYLVTRGARLSDIRYWTGPASDIDIGAPPDELHRTYIESLGKSTTPVNGGVPTLTKASPPGSALSPSPAGPPGSSLSGHTH